ncbi:hypothetical protein GBA52_015825 [Prunus armeniaca]|nr:hypothetical protein GBA52_015825 [Prunus armeniaca]
MPFPDALLVFSLFRFRWSDRCYVLMEVAFRFAGGCFVTGYLCLHLMEEDALELHRSVRWRWLCIDLGRPSANGLTRMRKIFFLYQQGLEPLGFKYGSSTLSEQAGPKWHPYHMRLW